MATYGNCLFYALWKWFTRGGYLIIRCGRVLKGVPHFAWASKNSLDDHSQIRHFAPVEPTKKPYAIWKALWFRGRVKHCDRLDCPVRDELCKTCPWLTESREE